MPQITSGQMDAVIKYVKEATTQEAFSLRLVDGPTSLTSSKIGGLPYWSHGRAFPQAGVADGDASFKLLAQLNMDDFHGDPRLPGKGLLQFFVATDDLCGLDFDVPDSQKGFRVVYHAEIDASVTPDDVLMLGISSGVDDEFFPVEKEKAISVSKVRSHITVADYRFDKMFAEALKHVAGHELAEGQSWWDLIEDDDRIWEEFGISEPSHLVFGWPFFT